MNSYISYFWSKNKERILKLSNENEINIDIDTPYLDVFACLPLFEKKCVLELP